MVKVLFGNGGVQFLERFMKNLPRDFWAWSQLPCWGSEAAPWSLETDLSLKPPCPVMSPVKGLLAAWELHKMLSWCLHDPHTPWVSHWETLFPLYHLPKQ